MKIEFTWWMLLIVGIVLMTLFWAIVLLLQRQAKLNLATNAPSTTKDKLLHALYLGLLSGPLLAFSLGALLPTHIILGPQQEHHKRYVFEPAHLASEAFGIYVVNNSDKTVIADYYEYDDSPDDSSDDDDTHKTMKTVAPGQRLAITKVPEYYYSYPPEEKKVKWLDFGIHREYYINIDEDNDSL